MLIGSIVNFASILICGIIGSLIRRGIPKRIVETILFGMALRVIYIGIDGLHIGETSMNPLVVIVSVGLGAAIGELIDIDGKMNKFGNFLQNKFGRADKESKENSTLGEAFVTTTILFCVGAMAINGALMSAQGNHDILFAKSVIDGITCLVLATTLGIGCCISAFSTFAYQGGLTIIFYLVISRIDNSSYMYTSIVNHMGCVGSLVIIAIGLNMLGIAKIKTANYIPAMFLPIAICPIMNAMGII